MALIEPGYFPDTYFSDRYFSADYWPVYGAGETYNELNLAITFCAAPRVIDKQFILSQVKFLDWTVVPYYQGYVTIVPYYKGYVTNQTVFQGYVEIER